MDTFSCEKCSRNFATEAGLIGHLAKVHADREKQTHITPTKD